MFVFIIILIIILYVAQARSKKNALNGIKYEYKLNKSAIEVDEPVEMVSTITNESRRFVSFIRMSESVPDGAILPENHLVTRKNKMIVNRNTYNSTIYLMARSRLKRKLKLVFPNRGWYVFNGASLTGGDYLGLSADMTKRFQLARTVTVYPKPLKSLQLNQLIGGFLGDISVRRFIMEDPILTIGTREYTGREPMKQVSWKHTARTNQMMVKQFDYTTEIVVTLVLDIEQPLGKTYSEDHFETCFSLARTVAEQLDKAKIPFDFTTNAMIAGFSKIEQNATRVSQNLGAAHLRFVLEKLGRSSYGTKESFAELVVKLHEGQKQSQNHSIIIISPSRDVAKSQLANRLKLENNGSLLFIYADNFLSKQGGESA